ncbi:MAG TPA: hypothetical protein DCZ94_20125 [Lentisphaeria bacterium]|nr:MAG: hypothetical protein A2X48_14770 [Lentisphaerae bacterium GWF2_49_21]HBC89254.1 hypothetical protein [Lentisphaeria bacterium]
MKGKIMNEEQAGGEKPSEKKNQIPYKGILIAVVVLIVAGTIILLPLTCGRGTGVAAEKTVKASGEAVCKVLDKISEICTSKENFSTRFGPIVSQDRFRRLQFIQRNQVCLFRIVRYMGEDKERHDYTEFYKKESDKKKLSELPILLKQYCEWEGKGTYEFNFYVDMSELSKWNIKWERGETVASSVLTLYPPDIGANTPAELEAPVFTCIADSITIDEGDTKERLMAAMPDLKVKLAEDQKQFMYEEARNAIAKHYRDFFRLIPELEKITEFPQIKVVFPHEMEVDRKKL